VVCRQAVLIDAQRSRNRDAVRAIRCRDEERLTNLTPRVPGQATIGKQDLQDLLEEQDLHVNHVIVLSCDPV